MTIQYSDGRTIDAVPLVRGEGMIRAALEGFDDVVEFTDVNGTWVSDDCEPVQIEFAWQNQKPNLRPGDESVLLPMKRYAD